MPVSCSQLRGSWPSLILYGETIAPANNMNAMRRGFTAFDVEDNAGQKVVLSPAAQVCDADTLEML